MAIAGAHGWSDEELGRRLGHSRQWVQQRKRNIVAWRVADYRALGALVGRTLDGLDAMDPGSSHTEKYRNTPAGNSTQHGNSLVGAR